MAVPCRHRFVLLLVILSVAAGTAAAAAWEAEARRLRVEVLQKVVYRGEAARWRDAPARVEWLQTIPGGPGYHIKKLRYEALPGMWIPALLYEPENLTGKVPVVMNVHGHSEPIGKTELPQQIRCINQAKRGILAMNVDWIGMGQLGAAGFGHQSRRPAGICQCSVVRAICDARRCPLARNPGLSSAGNPFFSAVRLSV